MPIAANLSTLFTDLPMVERFSAAKDAGFDAVEIQFPDEEPDRPALIRAARAAGLPVVLINLPRGGATMGLAALPGREADFAAALDMAAGLAADLGAVKVNVLAGQGPSARRQVLLDNLRRAGDRLGPEGLLVLTEPLNPLDQPDFFLTRLHPALDLLHEAAHPALRLQFDLYHMALSEPDLPAAIAQAGAMIGHVQFSDAPGRGAPGSGGIDFSAALRALEAAGYRGSLGAEYIAAAPTDFAWLAPLRALAPWSQGL